MLSSVQSNPIHIHLGNRNTTEIHSKNLKFTPISRNPEDTAFYQKLFSCPETMKHYIHGPRSSEQMKKRCEGWNEKWDNHNFSAFIIELGESKIGHLVIGHGDFEGEDKIDQGWSEAALVLDKNQSKKTFGEEASRVAVAYAKALSANGYKVPSDVTKEQQPEIENLLSKGKLKESDVKRDSENKVKWVYLPFKELRATSAKANVAATAILEKLLREHGGKKEKCDDKGQRFLYTLDLKPSFSFQRLLGY